MEFTTFCKGPAAYQIKTKGESAEQIIVETKKSEDQLVDEWLVDTEDLKDHLHKNIYIVANLPYYITTPIITKLTDEEIKIKQMVLMVQKEVGDRMTAKSNNKAYSSISVYLDYYYDVKKEFIVLAKYFTPKPKVDSVVISFNEKAKKYDVKNEEQFFKIIKEAFTFKRKNLKNNLFMYDLNIIEKLLQDVNKNLTYRAEQLTIEDFVYLSNNLGDKNE